MSSVLSIFVDESGDWGEIQPHSPYYIVTLLFHNQDNSIAEDNAVLDKNIAAIGFDPRSLHCGPIIRREGYYLNHSIDSRKKALRSLFSYFRHVEIQYTTLYIEKKDCADIVEMTNKLSKLLTTFIKEHLSFFQSFDNIILYYDFGQVELTRLLTSTLTALLSNFSLRRVKPSEYKLFQLADMLCTLELVAIKFDSNTASRSELDFFHSARDFKKNYLKVIRRKRLN